MTERSTILHVGDALTILHTLPGESVHCIVTSPPYYGLRDYGMEGQIGLEDTIPQYIARLVEVFRECWRVLRADGVLWINIGDSYANDGKWGGSTGGKHAQALHGNTGIGRRRQHTGLRPKNLMGVPWRVALALQDDGWTLRSDVIWFKPNVMPDGAPDRPTKAHEYVFMFTRSARYFYDADAVAEPAVQDEFRPTFRGGAYVNGNTFDNSGTGGRSPVVGNVRIGNATRNRRSVWTIATAQVRVAHYATMPAALAKICILAGCPVGGTVLDPFAGSGTTLRVAVGLDRNAIGIELNPQYADDARHLLAQTQPALFGLEAQP